MVEGERRYRVVVAKKVRRSRNGDQKIGRYGLSSMACRIRKTKTTFESARSAVDILGKHHSRILSVEPVEDGIEPQPQTEVPAREVRPYFAITPMKGPRLFLVRDGIKPSRAARRFFGVEITEVIPVTPEDFRQKARQLHKSGVTLSSKIRRYAGISPN